MNLPDDTTRGKAGQRIGCIALRRRRGYTLVEMLVTVMITSLILTSVAVALHSLFRVDRTLRDCTARSAAQGRFSLQFRADLHGAVAVQVNEDASTLSVQMPGETVEYRAEAGRVMRVVLRGEDVAHREIFALPDEAEVRWDGGSGEMPRTVAIEIRTRESAWDASRDSQRSERVEAVAGLNLPFTGSGVAAADR